jgi:hypothetical protein
MEWNSILDVISEFMILIAGTLLYTSILCIWYLVNQIRNNSVKTNYLLEKLLGEQNYTNQCLNILNAKIKMDITKEDN